MDKKGIIVINPLTDVDKLKALASEQRIALLDLLRKQTLNVNELAQALSLPQSNVATNIGILEKAGFVSAEKINATRGS